jgi:hypothetical protein
VRLLVPLLALLCGCAARGWRTSWVAVEPCTPHDVSPGTLLVRVVDAAGAPMPGVIVEARARRTGPVAIGVADASGSTRLRVTPASAIYELKASLPGFYATCIEDVRPLEGCATELRLPLRVAQR